MKSNRMAEGVFPPKHVGIVPQELGRWFAGLAEAGLLAFSSMRASKSPTFLPDPEDDVDPEDWETRHYLVSIVHVREPTQLIYCGEWLVYPMWGIVACHAYDITDREKPAKEQLWFDLLADPLEWFRRPGFDPQGEKLYRLLDRTDKLNLNL